MKEFLHKFEFCKSELLESLKIPTNKIRFAENRGHETVKFIKFEKTSNMTVRILAYHMFKLPEQIELVTIVEKSGKLNDESGHHYTFEMHEDETKVHHVTIDDHVYTVDNPMSISEYPEFKGPGNKIHVDAIKELAEYVRDEKK